MRLVKATSMAEIPVKGIAVDFEMVGDAIVAVNIMDADGNFFQVAKESEYSKQLAILIEKPAVIKTTLKATFTLPDGGLVQYSFDTIEQLHTKMELMGAVDYEVEYIEKEVRTDPLSGEEVDDCPF